MPDLSAYLRTKVPHYRTQEVLQELLGKYGINEIRFSHLGQDIILEFNYPQKHEGQIHKIGVRFRLTVPKAEDEKTQRQLRNQRYRALFYVLKSKLEAVEFGIREFGQEFLGDLIYTLPDGTKGTIAQLIGPKIEQSIIEGKSQVLLEDLR